jgi:plastocyanin
MRKLVPALALIAAAVLALALAACGSSSSSSTPSTSSAPAGGGGSGGGGGGSGGGGGGGAAAGAGSSVHISADPSGALAYQQKSVTASAPGKVTVDFSNQSPLMHNVTIADSSGKVLGATQTITGGSSSATVNLKPGNYTFYCSVDGHEAAGMKGTLTVK